MANNMSKMLERNLSPKGGAVLYSAATADIGALLDDLDTTTSGLHDFEAQYRLKKYGPNIAVKEKKKSPWIKFASTLWNPLVILLLILASVSIAIGDKKAAVMMFVMVVLGVSLRFFQELRADKAAQKLNALVSTTSTVIRSGGELEVKLSEVVPGDIVKLSAGDIVPADIRLITAKDLFINQASLTGESIPVEKFPSVADKSLKTALEAGNLCFMGTNIVSGTAVALVVLTGKDTFFGNLATRVAQTEQKTSFDIGIDKITWLMIGFMAVLVPLVFIINIISKGIWLEAFLFSVSVAVGLTPEMLPMIVTVNLSKGAMVMARDKVIVKKLSAIQNFGAMDVLCTDKTGTITQGRVVLVEHLDVDGEESDEVLEYGYLNSFYQTGLKNLLDFAVLEHTEIEEKLHVKESYKKIDEVPFDFARRRMSVVVEDKNNTHILICKGAVEETIQVCSHIKTQGKIVLFDDELKKKAYGLAFDANDDGFRVLALAYKETPAIDEAVFSVKDESNLVLLGFLAFLDPPRITALQAITSLQKNGVAVKILTGDNELVTKKICSQVGLQVDKIILGQDLDAMDDRQLEAIADKTTIFAKLDPSHKERIIRALKNNGHVVGFLGDGINDAPALKTADVGISVDSAVDIAKESSDIILLENSLLVLEKGVKEGRRVFGNIIKYIKMAASSNFGNMFSVLGASIFLPFLPMLPIQVLTNNLLYDFSQTTIPTDDVDEEWISKPRKWSIGSIRKFIIFIGPISSIFDYLTFFIMLFVFNAWNNPALFHTGWFVESLLTQTLIIHVIRTNKVPFIQSIASLPLTLTSLIIAAIGVYLPFSDLAKPLGLVEPPPLYWLLLFVMLICYVLLTQLVKGWFVRRFKE